MQVPFVRGAALSRNLPGYCKAKFRIADALRHECSRMASCSHFRFDLPVPGGGAAALARFGTHELSGLSGFETAKAQRGYISGSGRLR
jgi:hypothetical protein